jgi:hypothetical protein
MPILLKVLLISLGTACRYGPRKRNCKRLPYASHEWAVKMLPAGTITCRCKNTEHQAAIRVGGTLSRFARIPRDCDGVRQRHHRLRRKLPQWQMVGALREVRGEHRL